MVDLNPFNYIGWKTTVLGSASAAVYNNYETWVHIIQSMIQEGIVEAAAWTADNIMPTEESVTNIVLEHFDYVFKTADDIREPVKAIEKTVNIANNVMYLLSAAVGFGSEYYLERKKWSFTRGLLYSMGTYGFTVAVLQTSALRLGVSTVDKVIGKIDISNIGTVRQSVIDTIRSYGLPQQNIGDNL